jgi:hypothetical protein
MIPDDEWGEKVKFSVGYNNFNISTTTHRFQTIMSASEISTSVDALQLFDHCNMTSIYHDMPILAGMIATQFQVRTLVCHEKCNNSTTTDQFQSVRSELARSTPIDALRVVDHQNPTSIGKDTIICVSGNISQVQHVILFVVT